MATNYNPRGGGAGLPLFQIGRSTDQSITSASITLVVFDRQDYGNPDEFDEVSGGWKPSKPGTYQIVMGLGLSGIPALAHTVILLSSTTLGNDIELNSIDPGFLVAFGSIQGVFIVVITQDQIDNNEVVNTAIYYASGSGMKVRGNLPFTFMQVKQIV